MSHAWGQISCNAPVCNEGRNPHNMAALARAPTVSEAREREGIRILPKRNPRFSIQRVLPVLRRDGTFHNPAPHLQKLDELLNLSDPIRFWRNLTMVKQLFRLFRPSLVKFLTFRDRNAQMPDHYQELFDAMRSLSIRETPPCAAPSSCAP
jgi:hypothetical protein